MIPFQNNFLLLLRFKKTDEQLAPSEEYLVSGTLRFSLDFKKWNNDYTSIVVAGLAKVSLVPPSNIHIIDITSGSTIIKFQVRPPQPMVEASATETSRRINNAVFGDFIDTLIAAGLPTCELNAPDKIVTVGGAPRSTGCKRCRNGLEQAEKDHRDFTRKCTRGLCSRQEPFSIKSECARGCSDHCLTSCKRFHDPKIQKCSAARRKYADSQGNSALQPSQSTLISIIASPKSEIREYTESLIDQQNLAQLSVEDAQERTEVQVLSDCYAECSRQCIEHCIGAFGEPIPEQDLKSPPNESTTTTTSAPASLPAALRKHLI